MALVPRNRFSNITEKTPWRAMADELKKDFAPTQFHQLLMQYKYLCALRKITNGVTHQYNNIFTGLSGQLRSRKQDVEGDGVPEKRAELTEDLLRRGMEQTEILFGFSRAGESSEKVYAPQRLGAKAIDLLNTVSRMHRFSLTAGQDLPKIRGRQRDIILMLFYLGENAIAAMDDGGEIHLEVSATRRKGGGSAVQFCLVDRGTGLAEGQEVTAPVHSLYREETENIPGIGLYAVRAIVAEHGGTFRFAATPAGGTTAIVEIPAESKAQEDHTCPKVSAGPDSHNQSSPCSPRLEKHIFLVVDDEEAMRDLLSKRLGRRSHTVFCACSCEQALVEFRLLQGRVTVVLIDVGLSDADGYECARKMRKLNDKIQIVLMSGTESDQKKLKESGAAFLEKPFTIEQLEQIVNNGQL